jgi:hypothetical protein
MTVEKGDDGVVKRSLEYFSLVGGATLKRTLVLNFSRGTFLKKLQDF